MHSHAFGLDATDDRESSLYLVLYSSGRYGAYFFSLAGAVAALESAGGSAASVWRANRLIATYSPTGGVNNYA